MRTKRTIFRGRPLFVLALLVLGVARTTGGVGLRLGRQVTPHLGHGVAEGNGPTGLYGFFGCLFSYAVCQEDEICVNDNLFGSCQKIGSSVDEYQYSLSEDQVRQLEDEVERLVEGGYKWTDLYTQCVLGNVLLAFELNQHYDADFCKHKARPPTPPPAESFPLEEQQEEVEDLEDVLGVPESRRENDLFKGYDYDEGDVDGGGGGGGGNWDFLYPKRSADPLVQFYSRRMYLRSDPAVTDQSGALDFVTVHKYQKNRKRQFLIGQLRQNLDASRFRKEEQEEEEEEEAESRAKDFLSSLSPRELSLLESIVSDAYDDEDRREDIDAGDLGQVEEGEESTSDLQPTSFDLQPTSFDLEQKLDEDGEETEPEQEQEQEEEEQEEDGEEVQPDDPASQIGEEEDDQYYDARQVAAADTAPPAEDGRLDGTDDNAAAAASGVAMEIAQPVVVRNSPEDNTDHSDRSMASEWPAVRTSNGEKTPDEARPNIERIPDSGLMVEPKVEADELREGRGAGEVTTLPVAERATTLKAKYDIVDANYAYLSVMPKTNDPDIAGNIVTELQDLLHLPSDSFSDLSVYKGDINFRINHNQNGLNASTVAAKALSFSDELKNRTGLQIVGAGVGHVADAYISVEDVKTNGRKYFLLTFVLCGVIAGVVLAVILLYVIRRHRLARQKLVRLAQTTAEKAAPEVSKDYQELCRHHMQSKLSEKPEPLHVSGRVGSVSAIENAPVHSPSSRSSTSSWSEEPVTTSMDISTGHIVLSYMEDHLKNKDRLDEEWQALCAYEPEVSGVTVASLPQNERKNRYSDVLPYDHSRVVLHAATNMTGSDYINATTIMDHDPRNPAYLITQGPLPNTVADFWQMVWEQGSVVIVNLTKLTEQGTALCHCYWPSEGSDLYHIYEVHLVSEHIWCEDYLVRSFYLKNLQTNETRTVTQFHFLTWSDMKIPGSSKALLDFRRKVNKSYRGRSCPILVHCSDGAGRSGTYCLIDMVLNRMTKGAKEIDIAATLEHIRDQRMQMVKTKEQFQFVLATVAEEVHAILKALPQ